MITLSLCAFHPLPHKGSYDTISSIPIQRYARRAKKALCAVALSSQLFSLNTSVAAGPVQTGQAPGKLGNASAGAWNGQWEVTRDPPQITTKGGALALQLTIRHESNSATPRVRWTADRALCESPEEPPCERVGESGVATSARVVAGHLLVVIAVSADESDPFVIWLERPQEGRSRGGTLISARGDLAYRLDADRQ